MPSTQTNAKTSLGARAGPLRSEWFSNLYYVLNLSWDRVLWLQEIPQNWVNAGAGVDPVQTKNMQCTWVHNVNVRDLLDNYQMSECGPQTLCAVIAPLY